MADIKGYLKAIEHAAVAIDKDGDELVHVTDTDADGLVSAYGIDMLAQAKSKKVTRIFMERPFENVIKHIYGATKGPVVFTDHGGGNEEMLASHAQGRTTVIVDHHGRSESCKGRNLPSNIHCLNCDCWGIDGDSRASASTITYLLVKHLTDISSNAAVFLIGSLGDGNHRINKGQLHLDSIDEYVMMDVNVNSFYYDNSAPKNHQYLIRMPDGIAYDAMSLAQRITTLGCNRDVEKGALLGISIISQGMPSKGPSSIEQDVDDYERGVEARFDDIHQRLIDGSLPFVKTKNVVYFKVQDEFKDLNLKVVGTCARYLLSKGLPDIDEHTYLMAGMPVLPINVLGKDIPAFDDAEERLKVSIRTTPAIRERLCTKDGMRHMPSVCKLVELFMPGSGHNSHDERGAGILRVDATQGLIPLIQSYIDAYKPHLIDPTQRLNLPFDK